jgi:hypothetical protein
MPIDRVLDAEKRVECKDETQGNSATLRNNLEDISRNLNESRVDSHKDARSRKKQEIVEDLKCRYSGVYNRNSIKCQHIHRHYNIPVEVLLARDRG